MHRQAVAENIRGSVLESVCLSHHCTVHLKLKQSNIECKLYLKNKSFYKSITFKENKNLTQMKIRDMVASHLLVYIEL